MHERTQNNTISMRSKSTRARLPGQPLLDGKAKGIKEPFALSNKLTLEVLPRVQEAIQVAKLDTRTRIGSETEVSSMRREIDKVGEEEEIDQEGKQESRVATRLLSVPVRELTSCEIEAAEPGNFGIEQDHVERPTDAPHKDRYTETEFGSTRDKDHNRDTVVERAPELSNTHGNTTQISTEPIRQMSSVDKQENLATSQETGSAQGTASQREDYIQQAQVKQDNKKKVGKVYQMADGQMAEKTTEGINHRPQQNATGLDEQSDFSSAVQARWREIAQRTTYGKMLTKLLRGWMFKKENDDRVKFWTEHRMLREVTDALSEIESRATTEQQQVDETTAAAQQVEADE